MDASRIAEKHFVWTDKDFGLLSVPVFVPLKVGERKKREKETIAKMLHVAWLQGSKSGEHCELFLYFTTQINSW